MLNGRVTSLSATNGQMKYRILLVDDVFTTGATASACAAALKRAGAARVTVLTLARTDRRLAVEMPAPPAGMKPEAVGAA